MTRRQDLERHRRGLGEIREIMNSMKTLAYMETRKLSRFIDAQSSVVAGIEAAAADFLSFHPDTLSAADSPVRVCLLIGTERGFCGDFNQGLVRHFEATRQEQPAGEVIPIAVGHRLHTLLENEDGAVFIDGASVVEEIAAVLDRMVEALSVLQQRHGIVTVYGLYHGADDAVVMQKLLPPFQQCLQRAPGFTHPPLLNLAPSGFLFALTEQYLFAALNEMLYTSLMKENHNRVTHLEGAVSHLDDKLDDLGRRSNALRQEEIIEEIEVILLSADGPGDMPYN